MADITASQPTSDHRDLLIRQDLDAKLTMRDIARKHHCSLTTVDAVKKSDRYIRSTLSNTKKALPQKLYEIANLSISAITPAKLAAASAPQLITTAAIAIDKARLMEGLSTENMDIRAVVPRIQEQLDATVKAQAEVIELIRQRGGDYAIATNVQETVQEGLKA